jgi:4-diphosphocytidyl-2-C-methyl-D-erythritol kinase
MINFPTCKINLGLNILFKREDGFHEIETAMLEIPFSDELELHEANIDSFKTEGLEIPGSGNLVTDAVQLLRNDFEFPPVAIRLNKMVPMGGGLGGGSSDAAFTLKAINEQMNLGLSTAQLENYAAQLGSDCSFFIKGGLQLCTGRGEITQPLSIELPKLHLLIVNIGIHVPTKTAYSKVVPSKDKAAISSILQLPIEEWQGKLVNDFEVSVFNAHPELAEIKTDLLNNGAVYAAMSGSGSTMFGLFHQQPSSMEFSHTPVYEKWVQIGA